MSLFLMVVVMLVAMLCQFYVVTLVFQNVFYALSYVYCVRCKYF